MAALIPGAKTVIKTSYEDEDECQKCNHEAEVYEL
jgi:hypothetical protein